MNYAALVIAISDYTENTFPTADMNTFIQQAEQRIYNTIQFPSIRKNVTGILSTNNKYLSCPSDFLSPYSLAVIEGYGTATETYHYLLNKDVNFIREAYPTPADTALPKYYALFGPTTSAGTLQYQPTSCRLFLAQRQMHSTTQNFTTITILSPSPLQQPLGWVTTLILCCCMEVW